MSEIEMVRKAVELVPPDPKEDVEKAKEKFKALVGRQDFPVKPAKDIQALKHGHVQFGALNVASFRHFLETCGVDDEDITLGITLIAGYKQAKNQITSDDAANIPNE